MASENWSGGSGVEILVDRLYSQLVVSLVLLIVVVVVDDGGLVLVEVTSLCRADDNDA